jgi:hypothetical protein
LRKDEEVEKMIERSGYLAGVDLDGPNGCALLTVRVQVSVEEARRHARLMAEGAVIRVSLPEPEPARILTPSAKGTAGDVQR